MDEVDDVSDSKTVCEDNSDDEITDSMEQYSKQRLKEYSDFSEGDEQQDDEVKRKHLLAFVKNCYGDPDAEGAWSVPPNSQIFSR
jgi:uncharacterized protein YpuA (DUF1002 family)